MKQKDDVRERDQDDLLDERVLQRANGAVDQFAAIVKRFDRHARREARGDARDLFLHGLDHGVSVFARAHDDHAPDDFMAVHIERAAAEVAADLDARDITQEDRRSLAFAQDDVFEIRRALHEAEPPDNELHSVFLDDPAADIQAALPHGRHHLVERHTCGLHFERRHFDLPLPHEAADARDLGDAGHALQRVADEIILLGPKPPEVVAALRGLRGIHVEVILVHPAEAARIGAELWRDADREAVADGIQPLEHARTREVVVHVVAENHREQREAEHALRTHGLHAREPLELRRERIRHLVFDLAWRAAFPIREDDDLVFAEVGDRIHGRAAHLEDAERDEQQRAARDEEAVSQ